MYLVLPFPPKELSPNARIHFRAKAAVTKAHREQAHWLAMKAHDFQYWRHQFQKREEDEEIIVNLIFHPPDKRKRDADSMFSACKAMIDGIADALKVNDYRFGFTLKRAAPVKGGSVIVQIT